MSAQSWLKVFWTLAEAVPEWDSPASFDWFSAGESRHLNTLRFPKRRSEWLFGRLTAKKLLLNSVTSLKGVDPGSLSIENEPEGAPCVYLDGLRLDISLSISHRERLAFCALCEGQDCSLGADVEKIESREEAFAADYFTAKEIRWLDFQESASRDLLVTLIWSAKEAALKALRKGLRLDTRSVEIHPLISADADWGGFIVHTGEAEKLSWRGWWLVRGEYVLTLALLGPPQSVETAVLESVMGVDNKTFPSMSPVEFTRRGAFQAGKSPGRDRRIRRAH